MQTPGRAGEAQLPPSPPVRYTTPAAAPSVASATFSTTSATSPIVSAEARRVVASCSSVRRVAARSTCRAVARSRSIAAKRATPAAMWFAIVVAISRSPRDSSRGCA
ncbi:MAG: hypothetical protein KIT31_11885 [Deltaproteobacteria bacterium]|nr:hypothetical protein [Deltaproteobacteria bacterium]